jgi:Spy/CpxP family protein refolding chaperone
MVKAATTVESLAAAPARGVKHVAVALALAMAGTFAVTAWAQPVPGGTGAHGMHRMHGGGGGLMGPGLFFGRPEHVDRAVDRLLSGLDATEAQRSQILQIARAAAQDLHAQHEAARGQRDQGWALFTAPVVDARAVEALRQQRLAQHDQASKRMSQALLDVSAVLSPEQRAKLAERFKQREERMKQRMKDHAQQRRGAASAPAR